MLTLVCEAKCGSCDCNFVKLMKEFCQEVEVVAQVRRRGSGSSVTCGYRLNFTTQVPSMRAVFPLRGWCAQMFGRFGAGMKHFAQSNGSTLPSLHLWDVGTSCNACEVTRVCCHHRFSLVSCSCCSLLPCLPFADVVLYGCDAGGSACVVFSSGTCSGWHLYRRGESVFVLVISPRFGTVWRSAGLRDSSRT